MIPFQSHLVVGALSAAIAFGSGWTVQGWKRDSADLSRQEDAAELVRLRARTADAAAVSNEEFKERERVVYQTITETVDRIVERPVYRNICLDPDGLRALSDAIHGRASNPSEPAPAVSRPD
jgi:hypothetical protein